MNILFYLLIAILVITGALTGIMVFSTRLFFKREGIDYSILRFFKYMFFGRGYHNILPSEVKGKIESERDDAVVLDVRCTEAYQRGHIPGALSMPFSDLIVKGSATIEKDKPVIVACYGGGMSRAASAILSEQGFSKVLNMRGGMNAWNYEKEV